MNFIEMFFLIWPYVLGLCLLVRRWYRYAHAVPKASGVYYRDIENYRCPCGHFAGYHGHRECMVAVVGGGCACRLGRRQVEANAERWATRSPATDKLMQLINETRSGQVE